MKKLAARDFSDLLQVSMSSKNYTTPSQFTKQCSIPVFDGLLPEPHNSLVLELLFTLCHWQALAKLRLHTEDTRRIFKGVTTDLGECIRKFESTTCTKFDTKELPKETRARERRAAQSRQSNKPHSSTSNSTQQKSKRIKQLKQDTYKHHALGDYPEMIGEYGTTDSYSTEPVKFLLPFFEYLSQHYCLFIIHHSSQGELEHRKPKASYKRTSKKNFTRQIARNERRRTRLRRILLRVNPDALHDADGGARIFESHHHIGKSQNDYLHIGTFLRKHAGDPAIKVWLLKL